MVTMGTMAMNPEKPLASKVSVRSIMMAYNEAVSEAVICQG